MGCHEPAFLICSTKISKRKDLALMKCLLCCIQRLLGCKAQPWEGSCARRNHRGARVIQSATLQLRMYCTALSRPYSQAALRARRSWHAALGLSERALQPRHLERALVSSFPFIQSLDLGRCRIPEPGMLGAMANLRHLTALRLQLNDRGTSAALLDELQLLQGLTDLDLSG
jgi:hypothetical protein